MPIRPSEKHRYPKNWPEIRANILDRAGSRCENCGVYNYSLISRAGGKKTKIVLTVAHLRRTAQRTRHARNGDLELPL